MSDFISIVAQSVNIDSETAQKAVEEILAFLKNEGPPQEVESLLQAFPNAQLTSVPATGLMDLASRLFDLGLTMSDIQVIGKILFENAREKVEEESIGRIVASIPGLHQFV